MQTERTLLALKHCLPLLINGKIAIINDSKNTYTLYRIAKWIKIEDNYNPLDYSLVKDDKWGYFIDTANRGEKEQYQVFLQLGKEKILKVNPYRIGDKIHLHSRRGIYEVVDIDSKYITITCKKWQYEPQPNVITLKSDFKCLAGGIYNHNF